jgi:hypothetical protein
MSMSMEHARTAAISFRITLPAASTASYITGGVARVPSMQGAMCWDDGMTKGGVASPP